MDDYSKLSASDGTGEAVVANVETDRLSGATTLNVDNVDNWPTNFICVTGTLNPNNYIDNSSMSIFYGHLDAGNIVIDSFAAGYTDVGNTAGQIAIIKPTSEWVNQIVELARVSHNNDGSIKPSAIETAMPGGWKSDLPAVSTATHNGNRSMTLVHASSVAGKILPGTRRRFTRAIASNNYMGGAFNGTNHYFTKTTPTGTLSTVTNNFTFEAVVQPTAYQIGIICGRNDATPNNGLFLRMEADGTVTINIFNGAGNFRRATSNQALILNRKTHIGATWASGTVTMYFDGIAVATVTTTGGTAPTTAGTGGDFSIGRGGSFNSQYFAGYISNVAVYDAVLSAATIRAHATKPIAASEANCIGSWTLNNTGVNQQAAGTNDVTATNSVGYTNISPFGNNGASTTLEYAVTMSLSSDGLTEVIQFPEGCAVPDGTSTITSSSYSQDGVPYGFPVEKSRWILYCGLLATQQASGTTNGTYYNPGSIQLQVPIGKWQIFAAIAAQWNHNSTTFDDNLAISLSSSAVSALPNSHHRQYQANYTAGGGVALTKATFYFPVEFTTMTPLYALIMAGAGVTQQDIRGTNTGMQPSYISAENAYI